MDGKWDFNQLVDDNNKPLKQYAVGLEKHTCPRETYGW
jgi:hypothetical protein